MKNILFSICIIIMVGGCASPLEEASSSRGTFIKFGIPNQSHVRLSIENQYQKELYVPIDRVISPGTYTVDIRCSDLEGGVCYQNIYAFILNINNGETVYKDVMIAL